MTMMTSAYASKLLKRLNDDKSYYNRLETSGFCYIAATDEEPVIPDYDYEAVSQTLYELDEKIAAIKHAINLNNTINTILVDGEELTIDTVLVKMAMLSNRRSMLDHMRKEQPVQRMNGGYSPRKTAPEYKYINYDLEKVKKDYEILEAKIAAMQLALDKYNQTVEFEVNI